MIITSEQICKLSWLDVFLQNNFENTCTDKRTEKSILYYYLFQILLDPCRLRLLPSFLHFWICFSLASFHPTSINESLWISQLYSSAIYTWIANLSVVLLWCFTFSFSLQAFNSWRWTFWVVTFSITPISGSCLAASWCIFLPEAFAWSFSEFTFQTTDIHNFLISQWLLTLLLTVLALSKFYHSKQVM